jgi:hypothetical protein
MRPTVVALKGPHRLPATTLEAIGSGAGRDGISEIFPAEDVPGQFPIWPGEIAYFKGGCVLGNPFSVCNSKFEMLEESLTLNVASLESFSASTQENNDGSEIIDLDGWWLCLANWSHNVYFHWFAQCLASLEIAQRSPNFDRVKLILPRLAFWQRQSLAQLGIGPERILEIGAGVYRCEHLLYPSDLQNQSSVISSRLVSICRRLRDIVAANNPPATTGEKVYLARFDSGSRVMANEGALIDILRTRGYSIVMASGMDFAQEVLTFAKAKVVVSAVGSGMTNIAFCHPGSHVLEMNCLGPDYHLFKWLGHRCGLEVTSIPYDFPDTARDVVSPWRIDDVDALLTQIGEMEQRAGVA